MLLNPLVGHGLLTSCNFDVAIGHALCVSTGFGCAKCEGGLAKLTLVL